MFGKARDTLCGKTVVITGGTKGIGYELVRLLHSQNRILVIAREGPRLQKLSQDFPDVEVYGADLSVPSEYKAVADKMTRSYSSIDILINNAAVQYSPTFLDDDFVYETIEKEVHVNFIALCALSYLLLPGLLQGSKASAIVNVNSGLALSPKTSSAVYCATKAAVDSFSKSLQYQLEDTNVSVTQVFMPLVDTEMTQGRGKGKIDPFNAAEGIIEAIESRVTLKNIGKVKLLRFLLTVLPSVAKNIMKKA